MDLTGFQELLKVGALASISVYGVTQALKPLIKKVTKDWGKSLVRLFALGCGSFFGWYLGETPETVLSGFCGAAVSAVIVAKVKKKIKGAGCKADCESCQDG